MNIYGYEDTIRLHLPIFLYLPAYVSIIVMVIACSELGVENSHVTHADGRIVNAKLFLTTHLNIIIESYGYIKVSLQRIQKKKIKKKGGGFQTSL